MTNMNSSTADSHLLTKRENKYWRYQESVISSLNSLGVPLRTAELACIDFRASIGIALNNKLQPAVTASMLLSEVQRVYRYRSDNTAHQAEKSSTT
jgi:hypothetical protein